MSNVHNELVARIAREYTQPEGIAMAIIREAARLLMASGTREPEIRHYLFPAARRFVKGGRKQREGMSVPETVAYETLSMAVEHAEQVAEEKRKAVRALNRSLRQNKDKETT